MNAPLTLSITNLPNYNILIGCNIYIVYILPYSCIYILKLNVNVMNINKKYDVVINNNTKKYQLITTKY